MPINEADQKDISKKENVEDILDNLLLGYDCFRLTEVTSHQIELAEICQKEAGTVKTEQL